MQQLISVLGISSLETPCLFPTFLFPTLLSRAHLYSDPSWSSSYAVAGTNGFFSMVQRVGGVGPLEMSDLGDSVEEDMGDPHC